MSDRQLKDTFVLFGNCVPVEGARRSIICDLLLRRYQLIPNALYALLTERPKPSWEDLVTRASTKDLDTIRDYYLRLENAGYGFWTADPDSFPVIETAWEAPSVITNSVISLNETSSYDLRDIARQLDDAGCKALEIRILSPLTYEKLGSTLAAFSLGGLRSIDLYLPFEERLTEAHLASLVEVHQRLSSLTLYSAPSNKALLVTPLPTLVQWVSVALDSERCGFVSDKTFSINFSHFSEAQTYNTCLNRKVAVGVDGVLTGCPSMKLSCGHAPTSTLVEAVSHPALVQLATIKKDDIEVCRDCEFRYICTDCRVFADDHQGGLGKPIHCRYDPYSATWGA